MDKKSMWLLSLLFQAGTALAYHGTGTGPPVSGQKLPGWAIFLMFAFLVLLVYLGWRWWNKINESAFRK